MNSLPFYRFRHGIAAFWVFIFSSLHVAQAAVAEKAESAVSLAVGAIAPGVMLKAMGGVDFDLGAAMATKPTVLIFYRGGWCPYCNTQLAELQKYQDQFVALGYQILAITPDAPEAMPATAEKNALGYSLLS
jgi:peroxiredoxin